MQLLNLALKFYGIVKSLEMIMENIEEKNKDESQDVAISALERRIDGIEKVEAVYGGEPHQQTR